MQTELRDTVLCHEHPEQFVFCVFMWAIIGSSAIMGHRNFHGDRMRCFLVNEDHDMAGKEESGED